MKHIKNIINGLCMAVANSVPGVSGGTIALLLGFYDDMLGAINDLVFHKGKRLKGLIYIVFLAVGWLAGMVSAVFLLDKLFSDYIYAISSLFFGFVLCSIPIMVYDERKALKGRYYNAVFAVLGFAFIVAITYIMKIRIDNGNGVADLHSLTFTNAILLFFAGALAIIAMLLPGISGSTIFLVFGLYSPIMSALKELMTLNFKALPSLLFLGVGAVVGAFVGVKGIRFCLDRFRQQTVYVVVGMLVGSLYSILMGPITLKEPKPWMSVSRFNWWFFIIGAAIIGALQLFKLLKQKKLKENGTGTDE